MVIAQWPNILFCSFALTENYIVFVEQPFKLELRQYPKMLLLGKPPNQMFSWNPEEDVSQFISRDCVVF